MDFSREWAAPITWVAADEIRAAARLFATTKPALLEWGCAIEHTPKCIQTVRAISMLPVLTANIDVPGGWVFGMHGLGRFPSLIENLTPEANAKRLGADQFKLLGGDGADLPAAHIPTLLRAMREGKPYPVKVAHEARLHGLRGSFHDVSSGTGGHRSARCFVARAQPARRPSDSRG